MTEADIVHENRQYWVMKDSRTGNVCYTVMRCGVTHSVSDSSYTDLSLAIARCDYLAKANGGKNRE